MTIEQISITTPTTTVTWDEDNGAIIDDSDVVVTTTNASDTDIGIIANTDDPHINWQYQTFGVWETGRGEPSGTFGRSHRGRSHNRQRYSHNRQCDLYWTYRGRVRRCHRNQRLHYSQLRDGRC